MKSFRHSRIRSFKHALSGLIYVIRTQQNTWLHLLATVCVIALAAWLKLSRLDWAILILAIALVWMAEFINTAVEAVVDLASPERHPLGKVGKDVGAAAVLVAAFTAAILGFLILGPPLWLRLMTMLG
jgi:diacylglycerol kinase